MKSETEAKNQDEQMNHDKHPEVDNKPLRPTFRLRTGLRAGHTRPLTGFY